MLIYSLFTSKYSLRQKNECNFLDSRIISYYRNWRSSAPLVHNEVQILSGRHDKVKILQKKILTGPNFEIWISKHWNCKNYIKIKIYEWLYLWHNEVQILSGRHDKVKILQKKFSQEGSNNLKKIKGETCKKIGNRQDNFFHFYFFILQHEWYFYFLCVYLI